MGYPFGHLDFAIITVNRSQESQEKRQSLGRSLAPPSMQLSTSNDIPDPSPSSSTGTDITYIDDTSNVEPEGEPQPEPPPPPAEVAPPSPYVHTPYPGLTSPIQPELSVSAPHCC